MPRSPSAKLQRWFDLIHCLLSHRMPIAFETIEREVPGYGGTSKASQKRTFERDKDELRSLGIPIETEGAEGDNDAAYRLRPDAFYLPYLAVVGSGEWGAPRRIDRNGYRALATLTFEADELQVIADAATRAVQLGDAVLAAEARSALRKLAFDLPLDAASARSASLFVRPRAQPLPGVLDQLHGALLARKRTTIEYSSMSSGTTGPRTVEPYGLCFLSGHWYLVARDVELGGVRNFRANRILAVEVNTAKPRTPDFAIPPTFNLREHAQVREPWLLGDGEAIDAEVEFTPASGAARAAMELGAPVADEPGRRRFAVRRADVFARWLLSFAGDAVPLSPATVVAEFRALARTAQRLYPDPPLNSSRPEVFAE